MSDVTRILSRIESGDPSASEQLLPLVYDELRKVAAAKISRERSDESLEGTGLVHEAFLRLVDVEVRQQWNSRGHFFAAAANAMRRILVERARQRQQLKRGGGRRRQKLEDVAAQEPDERLLDLDDGLHRLAKESPSAARVVELRRFAGLSHDDVADALGITVYQARQKWTYARAWLRADLFEKKKS